MIPDWGTIAAWVGIGGTAAGGVYKFGQLRQEIVNFKEEMKEAKDYNEKQLAEMKAHNDRQHAELYESRNETGKALERLAALFEAMDKRQESMDKKLDMLLERRAVPRD